VNRAALIVAAVVAALGAALLLIYKQRFEREVSGGPRVGVLTSVVDIPLGAALGQEMIAVRQIPASYVEERHVLAADAQRVLGVRVNRELGAGDTILWSDLMVAGTGHRTLATILTPGMRAVAVPADPPSTLGGLLRPGDRVDAFLTLERPGSSELVTVALLQNLLVLATGDDVGAQLEDGRRGGGPRTTVTVEVTPGQAQVLTHAMARGAIRLVLRNPDDVAVLEAAPETTVADLITPERRERLQRRRSAGRNTPEREERGHAEPIE